MSNRSQHTKTKIHHAERPAPPSATELAAHVGLELTPALSSVQIQRLRRPLPGYVNLLDDVADHVAADADALGLDVSPEELRAVQADRNDLATREAALETVYTSAYQQRLVIDDRGMDLLRRVARRVAYLGQDNPDLFVRYRNLFDFLGAFKRGRRAPKPPASPQ